MRKPITPEAAQIRMADLCARSEQCEYDIRQKLYKMGIPSGCAAEIMEYLAANKFIDNARFARSYARDKCRFSSWGPYKIRMGLAAKRISQADIAQGLAALEEEDINGAVERVARAKARALSLHGDDSKEQRMKLYRHILSRGFDSQTAMRATRKMIAATKPGRSEDE